MSTMTEKAREYRLPLQSTPEDLECNWSTVLTFGDRILLAGHYYRPGRSWIAAVYEFLDDDNTDVDSPIALRTVSAEGFADNGHAVAWAIAHKDD